MICALYIPEVRFGNVASMEPIILAMVPQERYLKVSELGNVVVLKSSKSLIITILLKLFLTHLPIRTGTYLAFSFSDVLHLRSLWPCK